VTKNVEFATFTQTVMITTVLLITGSLLISSKTGSGINILYLLTGPIGTGDNSIASVRSSVCK